MDNKAPIQITFKLTDFFSAWFQPDFVGDYVGEKMSNFMTSRKGHFTGPWKGKTVVTF